MKSLNPIYHGRAEQISLGLLGIQRVVVEGVGVVVVNNAVVVDAVELVDLTIPYITTTRRIRITAAKQHPI